MAKNLESWKDEEIRAALLSHGENDIPITHTTRPLLLRKLAQLTQASSSSSDKFEAASVLADGQKTDCQNEEESVPNIYPKEEDLISDSQCASALEQSCYVLTVSSSAAEPSLCSEIQKLYANKAEAIKAMKNLPDARFKKFENRESAELFIQKQIQVLQEQSAKFRGENDQIDFCAELHDSENAISKEATTKPSVSEKPNNFPSLKTPALTKFRKIIERGDLSAFRESIRCNPRYLISSGDTPEILQISSHYNALHCAVKSGQISFCRELLSTIQSDWFWALVYPGDLDEIRCTRKTHLVDLYLNMQDTGNQETPLHFASKYGHKDIVSFLLSFPSIIVAPTNKYEKTPLDIVCLNASNAPEPLKKRIREILSAPEIYYVPVLRTLDNSTPPLLSAPSTLDQLDNVQSPITDERGTPVISNALAGPMSPLKAEEFYREWRSPSDSLGRKEAKNVKRSDPDRGFERVGRQLAHKRNVGWTEYWDFLDCSCDLTTTEGHKLLEEFLENISSATVNQHSSSLGGPRSLLDTSLEDPLVVGSYGFSPFSSHSEGQKDSTRSFRSSDILSDVNVSKELFGEDSEGSEDRAVVDNCSSTEITPRKVDSNPVESLADMFDSTLALESTDFYTPVKSIHTKTPETIFLTGSQPCKLDYDVKLALGEKGIDPIEFSHIHHWLQLVKSFSEQDQKRWRTPSSSKNRLVYRSDIRQVSPLVYASPSRHSNPDFPLVFSGSSTPSHSSSSQTPSLQNTPKRRTQTPGHHSFSTTNVWTTPQRGRTLGYGGGTQSPLQMGVAKHSRYVT